MRFCSKQKMVIQVCCSTEDENTLKKEIEVLKDTCKYFN